jgi:zinc protease
MIQTLTDAPAPFKGTEVHTLPNGLRLILKEDHLSPVVAMQAWARCGAIDETPNIYGISHGLEHMVFKGTPTRSAGQISRAIEGNGGAINAATQLETTHYYIDIPSYGAKSALTVLADTILNPTFPQEELERERLVILEEIHRRDDSPDATLWDEFAEHIFRDTPYGIKVIGSEATVSAMSQNDLFEYYRKHYVPEKMTVVLTGDFKMKPMVEFLTSLFKDLKPMRAPRTPEVHLEDRKPTINIIKKPVQMTYFAFGLPTVGIGHPDSIALDLLSDVLAGGASARLYQKLREETQTVFSVSCDYIGFQQKGLFAFFLESLPAKKDRVKDALMTELANIEKNPIQPAELARAKARIKSDWLYGSETPHGQASTLGSLAVLGELDMLSTYLNKINALGVDELMDAYRRLVKPDAFFETRIEPQS